MSQNGILLNLSNVQFILTEKKPTKQRPIIIHKNFTELTELYLMSILVEAGLSQEE